MEEEMKELEKGKMMLEYLIQLGVQYEWCIKHKKVLGCDESQQYYQRFLSYIGNDYCIGKNLLLQERKGEKRIFLLVVPYQKRVDLKEVSEQLGTKKLEFAHKEVVEGLLHTVSGNLSIFHLIYDQEK